MTKKYIKITRENVRFVGQLEQRLYVVTTEPADEHGTPLCVTRWEDDPPGTGWEATYTNASDEWEGIDEGILSEVLGMTFLVRRMISRY